MGIFACFDQSFCSTKERLLGLIIKMRFIKFLVLIAAAYSIVQAGKKAKPEKECMQMKKQDSNYWFGLGGERVKSIIYPLKRIGTQSLQRSLGKIVFNHVGVKFIEMLVDVTFPTGDNKNHILELSEIHGEDGCGDFSENDCVTDVKDDQYPMWTFCKNVEFVPVEFLPEQFGLEMKMKADRKFLLITVGDKLAAKVSLPPVVCDPTASRRRITGISYEAESKLFTPVICKFN